MTQSTESPAFRYYAFISYSHRDKLWADWLHKALEIYAIPKRLVGQATAAGVIPKRLTPIFRDRDELASAHDLSDKVNQALTQSANLIVICSPRSATSRWVNEEVLAFKRLGRTERIFCLIVDGEPSTDDPAEQCFAPALRFHLDMRGQIGDEPAEPIAADARPGKDGKGNARLKLVAGLLDVGFDALKQRELHRRTRRLAAVSALALVVMTLTSLLAVAALISRHKAVTAQQTAVVAQQTAERRQKQAEGLVDFMLGDLTDKLQAESHLDILMSVDDKAMAYFKSLPASDASDTALAQRATALQAIGDTRMREGQLAGALEAFRGSSAIGARLAAATPSNIPLQVAYSRTLTYVGLIFQQQHKLEDAQRTYETAEQVLQPALKQAPDDLPLLLQLSYIENNSGALLLARGDLTAAKARFTTLLHISQKLVADATTELSADNSVYVLIQAHRNLAHLATQVGDLVATTTEFRAAADDAIDANKRFPTDGQVRGTMFSTVGDRGLSWVQIGEPEKGLSDLQAAVAGYRKLVTTDPKNTDFLNSFSQYLVGLGRVQRLTGDIRAAGDSLASGVDIASGLAKKDASQKEWQRRYAIALTEWAAQAHAADNDAVAQTRVHEALAILDPMPGKHSSKLAALLATEHARLLLASVIADPAAARTLRQHALDSIQAVKTGHADPTLLALHVEALLDLGRKDEAQPLIKRLWNEGYRDPGFVASMGRHHIDFPINKTFEADVLAASNRAVADSPGPNTLPATNP